MSSNRPTSKHVRFAEEQEPQQAISYDELISACRHRFPNLNFLHEELTFQGSDDSTAHGLRAAAVDYSIGPGSHPSPQTIVFQRPEDLRGYLSHTRTGAAQRAQRLFVLEDIAKPYLLPLAKSLGNHLDATVVASHLRMRDSTHFWWSNAPTLNSLNRRVSSFSIQYQELHLGLPRLEDSHGKNALFCNAHVHREVLAADTTHSRVRTDIAIVPRKATFWCQSQDSASWTGVVFLDPPVGDFVINKTSKHASAEEKIFFTTEERFPRNRLYQGGYADFKEWPTSQDPIDVDSLSEGPSRRSALDDFLFHLERSHGNTVSLPPKDLVCDILEKLAISNWIVLVEYLRHKFFQLEQSAQEGLKLEDLKARKEVHRWRRSCAMFLEEVRSTMTSMKGVQTDGSTTSERKLNEAWDYIVTNLEALRDRIDDVANTSVALLAVLDSHKSLQEASDVGRLTRLGMLFLPLSFTAALFSMADDYGPGKSGFWIYFAAGIPLTLLVLLVASLEYVGKSSGTWSLGSVTWNFPRAYLRRFSIGGAWRRAHGIEKKLKDLEKKLHPPRPEAP